MYEFFLTLIDWECWETVCFVDSRLPIFPETKQRETLAVEGP